MEKAAQAGFFNVGLKGEKEMWFEMWLKEKGHDLKKLKRKEGRELWKEFKREMTPVIKDCTAFLNAAYKTGKRDR